MNVWFHFFSSSPVAASTWEDDGEHTDAQVLGCKAVGYLSYGCSFLFACLILFLRKQIALANGVVKVNPAAPNHNTP